MSHAEDPRPQTGAMPRPSDGIPAAPLRRPLPLLHARVLIAVVLFAALAGLAVVLLPGTDQPATPAAPRLGDVQRALDDSLGPAARDIQVALSERTVVLQGAVPSEDLRRQAVESVLALDAVVEVDDELTVSPP